jgi:hypothetical protein
MQPKPTTRCAKRKGSGARPKATQLMVLGMAKKPHTPLLYFSTDPWIILYNDHSLHQFSLLCGSTNNTWTTWCFPSPIQSAQPSQVADCGAHGLKSKKQTCGACSFRPLRRSNPSYLRTWPALSVDCTKHDILARHNKFWTVTSQHKCEDRVVPKISTQWVAQYDTFSVVLGPARHENGPMANP